MVRTRYKTIKFFVSAVIALVGVVLTVRWSTDAALPGELQEASILMLLGGMAAIYGLACWIASRAIFWIVEIWMPIQEVNVPRFRVGVTRLSRLLAIVVPIGLFFLNVADGRLALTHVSSPYNSGYTLGTVMAFPLVGGLTWLVVQVIGWVVEGFRRKNI